MRGALADASVWIDITGLLAPHLSRVFSISNSYDVDGVYVCVCVCVCVCARMCVFERVYVSAFTSAKVFFFFNRGPQSVYKSR